MGQAEIVQRYTNHRGLNLKESDLTRPIEFASAMLNAQYHRRDGGPESRRGYQMRAGSAGGFGLAAYNRIDPATDLPAPEVLSVGRDLFRRAVSGFSVHYSGAASPVDFTLFFDPSSGVYRVHLMIADALALDFPLGTGFDEAMPVSLLDLKNALNAIPNVAATITGGTGVPAAFLPITREFDLLTGDFSGIAYSWETVNSTVAHPFDGAYGARNDADFENVSTAQIGNVLYLASGLDEVQKYDGQTVYRAGLPDLATLVTAFAAGAGAISGTKYLYRVRYVQYDAAGNIIEGNLFRTQNQLDPVNQNITVTAANVLAGSGFNTNGAIVVGNQAATNVIDVDDGAGGAHTLRVGDSAYFFDAVTGDYVVRKVTARAVGSITVAGAPVTVADNAPISNNLRIQINRSRSSGSTPELFYLVAEIPNDSFHATQVYTDSTLDADLGAELTTPITDRSPPPKARYLAVFQGSIVALGNPSEPRRIAWSDIDGPEFFPADIHQIDLDAPAGQTLSGGHASGGYFAVFTRGGATGTTHLLSGTLADDNVRLELRDAEIGCEAHASIVEANGVLRWWSGNGPYQMAGGQIPVPLGRADSGAGRLEPLMDQSGKFPEEMFQFRRIQAFIWTNEQKALFFLPAESTTAGERASNENSRVFAYDMSRDAWLEWANFDLSSGVRQIGQDVFFQGRRYSDFANAVRSEIHAALRNGDAWDYQDNTLPITWEYATGWEALGSPAVLKQFLRLRVYELTDIPNNDFTLHVVQEVNYQRGDPAAEFDLDFSGQGYGAAPYGTVPYGSDAEAVVRHDLKRTRLRSTRLRFQNSEPQQNPILTGWEFLIQQPFAPGFKP